LESLHAATDYPYTAVSSGDHFVIRFFVKKDGVCTQHLQCATVLIAMPPQDLGLTNLPTCLENVKIKSMPNSAYYVADFISQEEEEIILNKVGISSPALDRNRSLNGMTDKQSIGCHGS